MREIKFRNMVYREQCKDWVTYSHTLEDLVENSDMDVFENIWEQYTGLKDKNGKEIYEGDIVKCWDEVGEVYFDDVLLQYRAKFIDEDDEDLASCEPEVIGNIHENKELLGGEE